MLPDYIVSSSAVSVHTYVRLSIIISTSIIFVILRTSSNLVTFRVPGLYLHGFDEHNFAIASEAILSLWDKVTSSFKITVLVCSGVCWVDMHKLAERVELEELKKMGLLQGEVDQMMEVRRCVVHVCMRVHQCQLYLLPPVDTWR